MNKTFRKTHLLISFNIHTRFFPRLSILPFFRERNGNLSPKLSFRLQIPLQVLHLVLQDDQKLCKFKIKVDKPCFYLHLSGSVPITSIPSNLPH